MAATSMETCLKSVRSLPDDLRGRVALVDETLYISEEQKGKIEIINLATRASGLGGIGGIIFVPPARFDAQYVRYAVRTGLGDNEIQQMAIDLIARGHAQGASDIHIADMGTFCKIRFRVLGMLTDDSELDGFTGRQLIRVIYDHLGASQDTSAFNNKFSLDARIADRNVLPHGVHSVRIHSEPTECIHGEDGSGTFMALRLIHDTSGASGTLEERLARLGFTDVDVTITDRSGKQRMACAQTGIFRRLADRNGMTLISGCTGSGKSTALAHTMEALIQERPGDNFISVEDPPEKPIVGMHQIRVNSKDDQQRSGGASAYTMAIAGTNRDDPDTVMIGEIRYADAAMAAIEVAQSGHAVWATIHASDAFGILTRLEVMLRGHMAEPLRTVCDPTVLSGVEYQRLIARLCPHCRKPLREDRQALRPALRARLERCLPPELIYGDSRHDGIFLRNHEGCDHCRSGGQPGLWRQTVVAEVVPIDSSMLTMLREGGMDEARAYWRDELHGMSYFEHARHLLTEGVLDPVTTEDQLSMPIDYDLDRDRRRPATKGAERWL